MGEKPQGGRGRGPLALAILISLLIVAGAVWLGLRPPEPRTEVEAVMRVHLRFVDAAVAGDSGSSFYVGAGIGNTFFSDSYEDAFDQAKEIDENSTAWKIFGGFTGNRFLGIEGGYRDFGTTESDFGGETLKNSIKGWDVEALGRRAQVGAVEEGREIDDAAAVVAPEAVPGVGAGRPGRRRSAVLELGFPLLQEGVAALGRVGRVVAGVAVLDQHRPDTRFKELQLLS